MLGELGEDRAGRAGGGFVCGATGLLRALWGTAWRGEGSLRPSKAVLSACDI